MLIPCRYVDLSTLSTDDLITYRERYLAKWMAFFQSSTNFKMLTFEGNTVADAVARRENQGLELIDEDLLVLNQEIARRLKE